jgi:hypothetical protein
LGFAALPLPPRCKKPQPETTQIKKEQIKQTAIPKLVRTVDFAPEQTLRDITLACPASGISKQFEYILLVIFIFLFFYFYGSMFFATQNPPTSSTTTIAGSDFLSEVDSGQIQSAFGQSSF